MSTAVVTDKILCNECQRENEPERVYCHHCGARLDRAAIVSKKEPVADTRKRVKKIFQPQFVRLRALFFKASKMILTAVALAALIEIALPPDIPPPTKALVLASQMRIDMENAIARHQPPQLDFSEDQVNAYLASALKPKQAALNKPMLDFKRAVATLGEGICTITVERSLSGSYSVYSSSGYGVAVANGKLVARQKAGHIGRLPIHPRIMQAIDLIFADVFAVLERDAKLIAKFSAIQLHDKHAVLSVAAP